ncbi:MAG TPA: (4Fe-4S)-binding protein [Acidimicrobiales bacterium]|nr:(4Fe-4S)-binding protein [Acidimicrobiales bacterium]
MRIVLDTDLCQGHGVCESEAPGIFELGKSPPVRLLEERPPEARRTEVEAAVRFCPTSALRIIEEE